ncbi:MAG: tyrosine-type recombinase/integrase [Thermoleophilaceae bacterium]|nr:tyrosine-type recombinase/integrase [Thermoleophilaceae bacterium]
MEAVAAAADTDLYAALYRVAAYSGLRLGELRALRWRDVDFVNATIHVRRNLPVHATEEKVPKGKRVRSLPLFDQAARMIDGLSRRGYLTRPDDLVFTGLAGGRLGYEHVRERFYVALDAAGLGDLRSKQAAHLPRPAPLIRHDGGPDLPANRRADVHGPREDRDHDALRPPRAEDGRGRQGFGVHCGPTRKRVPAVSRTTAFGRD